MHFSKNTHFVETVKEHEIAYIFVAKSLVTQQTKETSVRTNLTLTIPLVGTHARACTVDTLESVFQSELNLERELITMFKSTPRKDKEILRFK